MNTHDASTLPFLPCTGKFSALPGPIMNHQRKKCLLLAGLMVAAACGIGQKAEAQGPPPINIENCGFVIDEPGSYFVPKSLQSESDTVDCIQINASGVYVAVKGTLAGPGTANATAAGIRINSKATGVQVNLGPSTVEKFGVGIVVEGSGVSVTGNGDVFNVQNNVAQGVLVSNASNVQLEGLDAIGNGQAGLELSNASGVIVSGDTTLSSNGTYGLWVNGSSGNQFYFIQAFSNTAGGIYVGESGAVGGHANGRSATCPLCIFGGSANGKSEHNFLISGAVFGNEGDGIVIGNGDSGNLITNMEGTENKGTDAVDESKSCSNNTWFKNIFTTAEPGCIQ
jgi:hypothetical protein